MNQDLADELHRRADADQAARLHWQETRETSNIPGVDEDNTAWLKSVIAKHGWPGISLVGEQGAREAWLLAQHADRDPTFQEKALELLKTAVTAGDALPENLAYLTDRVLIARGQPQLYGTQYTGDRGTLRRQPVTDPERLDERRAAMQLDTAAESDRRMNAL
ncbi:DUF6624 domain-containing protein [Streptomyces sp. 147326]|uniref:DUF6624 domain-containing protein n=1 Tax=Streptomyces sp. 147326 TaxID=3074379 RepID=UPI00385719AF